MKKKSAMQKRIIEFLANKENAKLIDILQGVGYSCYCNENFYFGQILSNMVKLDYIERTQKGVFRIKNKATDIIDIGLFSL